MTQDVWDKFNKFPEELNAESKKDIFERIKSFFDELKGSNENILIVTHGGAWRMIMYYLYNDKVFDIEEYLNKFNNLKINNADIFEVNIKEHTIETYKK